MEKEDLRIFVYGSLRSGFHHPAYEYISRYFTKVANATVKGKMYDMGSFPAAVPASDDHFIIGELYQLKNEEEFEWAFEQLDDYEGVIPDGNEVSLYVRSKTQVFLDNETTTAWIYWYNGKIEDQPLIASGDVLEFIQHKSKL